jgi:hypothetical protein
MQIIRFFHKRKIAKDHALLFINGPYQLIVGLACIRKYLSSQIELEVIGYDMPWQKELRDVVIKISKVLKIEYRYIPLEFQKSDFNYKRTYRLRSLINQMYIKAFVQFHSANNIFVPKLVGNPERAIVLGAKKKSIYVFDDGLEFYVNSLSNKVSLNEKSKKYIYRLKLKNRLETIKICPSRPIFFDLPLLPGCVLYKKDYSNEIEEIFEGLAKSFQQHLKIILQLNNAIIVCLPRLWTLNPNKANQIFDLIDFINEQRKDIYILLKPHPRDKQHDVEKFFSKNVSRNCVLLEPMLWVFPIEILARMIDAKLILSGISTIAMNQKLIKELDVIITTLLGDENSDFILDATAFLKDKNILLESEINSIEKLVEEKISTW